MVLLSGLGLLLALVFGFGWHRKVREEDRREEQRRQAILARQRVLDFMPLMADALGEGLTRQELRQRVVHASILCTGALSSCIFERTGRHTMRGVAIEGLFPPHRPLPEKTKGLLTTRAKF